MSLGRGADLQGSELFLGTGALASALAAANPGQLLRRIRFVSVLFL